ncbi:MAG: tetratricopeptide repeat protein [Acidobacteria bacterium]|nr:tetratricopeptide repeat protein [Acidobacteriota bacterium]
MIIAIQKLALPFLLFSCLTIALATAQEAPAPAAKGKSKKAKDANTPQAVKLSKSKPVEGTLTAGQTQTYRLKLKANYFVSLAVEPQTSPLSIAVLAPTGERLIETKRKSGEKAAQPVSFIADSAGEYMLELHSTENEIGEGAKQAAGKETKAAYHLAIAERRAATAADRTRLAADRLLREAKQLRADKKPEALPSAREKLLAALKLRHEAQERAGEAVVLHELGEVASELKEFKEALDYFQQELKLRQELNDRKGSADATEAMGEVHNANGQFRAAIPVLTQAKTLFHELGESKEEGITTTNIAIAHFQLREYQQANEAYEQALPLTRAAQDRATETAVLYQMGRVQEALGKPELALDAYNQLLAAHRADKDQAGEANMLYELGEFFYVIGKWAEARDQFLLALPLLHELKKDGQEAMTLNYLGVVNKSLGEKQTALDYYDKALARSRELKNQRLEATVISNVGALYNSFGERKKALAQYDEALLLRRAVKDKNGEANTLNNMATVYADLGENQRALDCYQAALAHWRTTTQQRNEAITLQNIGQTYDRLGEKQLAFEHFQQALAVAQKLKLLPVLAPTLTNIGSLYLSLGDREQALQYYQQALALTREMGAKTFEAETLHVLGYWYYEAGEREQAREIFSEDLKLWRTLQDKGGESNTLAATGFVERELGHTDKALEILTQALALHREVGNRGGQADTLSHLALTYRVLNQPAQARAALADALALARDISDPSREINTRYQLARLNAEEGQLDEARTQLEAALGLVETVRTKVASQDLRASYFATAQKYYDLYIDVLMRQHEENKDGGFDGQALQAAERARARGLLDSLNEAGANIRSGVDAGLLARESNLQQRINKWADALTLARTDERVAEAKRELDALYVEYRDVQTQIRQNSPRYAALTQPQPLALADIQKQVLDDDTVLLEFALGEQRSYLWAVTPRTIHSFTLPNRAELETAAQRLYQLLTARDTKQRLTNPVQVNGRDATPAEADAAYWREAEPLSRALLGPIATQLRGVWKDKRLLIVADGALQFLPFSALPLPKDEGGRMKDERRTRVAQKRRTAPHPSSLIPHPLVLDHEIVSLPSASTMSVLRQELKGRQPASGAVAVIADPVFESGDERVKAHVGAPAAKADEPAAATNLTRALFLKKLGTQGGRIPRLPATRDEAERIVAAASGAAASGAAASGAAASGAATPKSVDNDVFRALDFQANRATVTSGELGRYRIVHLATHAYFDSERPELSAILLSLVDENGQPQDGFLRAHEVYNFNLPAELVVLSACETGLGKQVRGEGLIGLTRGFMYAGAARVAVTLWAVSDKGTSELMARFYRNLLQDKQRPAAALRAAQIALWQEQRWQAPYYWAPFVLQGEWR